MSTSVEALPSAIDSARSELRLEVPGNRDHVRVVRLVAIDASERAGFDCDRTDDVCIAVDELCHAVMSSTDAPMTLRFAIAPGRVEVDVRARRRSSRKPFALSDLSDRVVRAVSDSFEFQDGKTELRFVLRISDPGWPRS